MTTSTMITPPPPADPAETDLDAPEVATVPPGRRRNPHRALTAWWDGVPMRARLVGILVVLLIAALATTGWTTQHVLRSTLVGQVNARLTSSAHQFVQQSGQPYG